MISAHSGGARIRTISAACAQKLTADLGERAALTSMGFFTESLEPLQWRPLIGEICKDGPESGRHRSVWPILNQYEAPYIRETFQTGPGPQDAHNI